MVIRIINKTLVSACLSTLFLLFSSCESLFIDSPESSPEAIFQETWSFADTHYSFFALKGIDWNQVGNTYRPMVREDMTERELFDLLAQMLNELQDGHVNLRSPFDLSRYWDWHLDYDQNFDSILLTREYFRDKQEYAGPFVIFDFVEQNIGYVQYSSFAQHIREEHLDFLFQRFEDRDALIIDVRDNGGGSGANARRLAGRLVHEPMVRGYQEYKNGPGHEDFSDPLEVIITPPPEGLIWEKPVTILTNRSSYSATNLFVALVKGLPNVTVMGDKSGGGGGTPAFRELSNGWLLRVSAHRLFVQDWLGIDEWRNVEDGIDPDIYESMDPDDAIAGRDTILERALGSF